MLQGHGTASHGAVVPATATATSAAAEQQGHDDWAAFMEAPAAAPASAAAPAAAHEDHWDAFQVHLQSTLYACMHASYPAHIHGMR